MNKEKKMIQREKIIELFKKGKTIEEIGKELGMNLQKISNILKNHRIKVHSGSFPKYLKNFRNRIIEISLDRKKEVKI